MKKILFEIALLGAIFFFFNTAAAQDIESVVEQMAEDGASESAIEDYLQQIETGIRRLNLNLADRQQLEGSGLFSPFQIASLLEYRADYGALLSMAELQMVDGFSAEFVARIATAVTLTGDTDRPGTHLQARSRYKWKQGTPGLHQYNRVLLESGRFSAGLLAESDAGEIPIADHLGGYLGYKHGPFEVLVGDYSACFGQGLALWNSFAFTGASSPASVMRRPRGIVPYTSASESAAFRGVAAGLGLGRFKVSAFASAAGVDARVSDKGYESLIKTGYHRTIYEKGCKKAMREYLAGANVTFRGSQFQAGITAAAYSFSEHNARKVMPYNQFQLYDGWMGNLSADVLYSAGHWRLFAEAALCSCKTAAAVAGAVLTASYSFEASLMLRYYDKGYIAPHAGAYSTISSVSNQAGAVLAVMARPLRGLLVTSFTEAVHYPYLRYRVDGPSSAFYEKLKAEYAFPLVTISVQDNYLWQSAGKERKHSLKGSVKFESGPWKASARVGAVFFTSDKGPQSGWALSVNAARTLLRGRATVQAGAGWYEALSYDARVYLFESDLPGNFSLQYYYGKGIAARGLVKVKIGRRWSLSLLAAVSQGAEGRLQADYKF